MNSKYVLCINNKDYPLDLTLHKVYRVIPDEQAAKHGRVRIMDDTGEDYLFSSKHFVPVDLSETAERAFETQPA